MGNNSSSSHNHEPLGAFQRGTYGDAINTVNDKKMSRETNEKLKQGNAPGNDDSYCINYAQLLSTTNSSYLLTIQKSASFRQSKKSPRKMDRLRRSFRDSFRRRKDRLPESSKPHQWQSDEQAVRSATCSFPVKYMGCVEVYESRGMQVCEEALKVLRVRRIKNSPLVQFSSVPFNSSF